MNEIIRFDDGYEFNRKNVVIECDPAYVSHFRDVCEGVMQLQDVIARRLLGDELVDRHNEKLEIELNANMSVYSDASDKELDLLEGDSDDEFETNCDSPFDGPNPGEDEDMLAYNDIASGISRYLNRIVPQVGGYKYDIGTDNYCGYQYQGFVNGELLIMAMSMFIDKDGSLLIKFTASSKMAIPEPPAITAEDFIAVQGVAKQELSELAALSDEEIRDRLKI